MKKTTSKNTSTAKKKATPAKKTSSAKSTSEPKKKTGTAKTATPAKKKTPAAKSPSKKTSSKGILSKAKDALLDAGRALVPAAKTGIAVGAAAAGAFIEEAAGKPKRGKTGTKTSS